MIKNVFNFSRRKTALFISIIKMEDLRARMNNLDQDVYVPCEFLDDVYA